MKCKAIAITGQIGSGKSLMGDYLRQKGYEVIDCDQLSRIVADLPQTVSEVERLFGSSYVVEGKLNRAKIRAEILADEQKCNQYNALFFSQIKNLLTTAVQNSNQSVVFVEIPLIDAFDFSWYQIWQVQSSTSNRVQRVVQRDGVDEKDVISISNMQNYQAKPTHVIVNDGTKEQFFEKIDFLLSKNV